MKIKIQYCGVWNYLPEASRLEEEIKGKFSEAKIELIEGNSGVFIITVNEKEVFNKAKTFRFPNKNEISELI